MRGNSNLSKGLLKTADDKNKNERRIIIIGLIGLLLILSLGGGVIYLLWERHARSGNSNTAVLDEQSLLPGFSLSCRLAAG